MQNGTLPRKLREVLHASQLPCLEQVSFGQGQGSMGGAVEVMKKSTCSRYIMGSVGHTGRIYFSLAKTPVSSQYPLGNHAEIRTGKRHVKTSLQYSGYINVFSSGRKGV